MPHFVLSKGVFVPFTYTKVEIDDIFKLIPISRYGELNDDPIPVSISGVNVTVGPTPLIMMGRKYLLDTATVTTVSTSNSLRWLYITIVDGVPGYVLRDTYYVDEAPDVMYVGSITTDVNHRVTADIRKVTRLDNYRLSATNIGSAIPVSTGDATGTGNFAW